MRRVGGLGGDLTVNPNPQREYCLDPKSQVLSRREVIYRPSSLVLCHADELHEEKNDAGGGEPPVNNKPPFFFFLNNTSESLASRPSDVTALPLQEKLQPGS